MFGDSIVICVFWGRRNERGSLRGIIYKSVTVRCHVEKELQNSYRKTILNVYLKGGNFK